MVHSSGSVDCPECGYDLAGHVIPAKCPECGVRVTEAWLAEHAKEQDGGLIFFRAVWPMVLVVIGVPGLWFLGMVLAEFEVNLDWPVFAIWIGLGMLFLPVTAGRALGVAFLSAKSGSRPRARKDRAVAARASMYSFIMLIWFGLVILFVWAVIWLANFDGR